MCVQVINMDDSKDLATFGAFCLELGNMDAKVKCPVDKPIHQRQFHFNFKFIYFLKVSAKWLQYRLFYTQIQIIQN